MFKKIAIVRDTIMSKIAIRHNLDFNYKFFLPVALIFQGKTIKMNSKSIAYWAK